MLDLIDVTIGGESSRVESLVAAKIRGEIVGVLSVVDGSRVDATR